MSDGKRHDVPALDLLAPEPGAFYVMDRGYVDFGRLYVLHRAGSFFVTRAQSNRDFHRVYSAHIDRSTGILCDQTIALDGFRTKQDSPAHLRRVRFKDPETGKTLVFLTHRMTLPASTMGALYKNRGQGELFFKWIKQPLRIQGFFGTSENAVKTPIRIAMSLYLLVAIVKKKFNWMPRSTLCHRFCQSLCSRRCPCSKPSREMTPVPNTPLVNNQLNLFEF